MNNQRSSSPHLPRIPLVWPGLCGCAAFVLSFLTLSLIPAQRIALAGTVPRVQRYTLCASSAISDSLLAQLHVELSVRLATDPGITATQMARASSRCLAVTVTARGLDAAAVAAAGKVGNVVTADSGRDNLNVGTRVQLVCTTPGCAPGIRLGRASPAAHPPVLRVILADRDVLQQSRVTVLTDGIGGKAIAYRLTKQASRRWCSFTKRHVGRSVATVVDGVVLDDAVMESPICGGQGPIVPVLQGRRQAYWIAGYIKTGPLPLALRPVLK